MDPDPAARRPPATLQRFVSEHHRRGTVGRSLLLHSAPHASWTPHQTYNSIPTVYRAIAERPLLLYLASYHVLYHAIPFQGLVRPATETETNVTLFWPAGFAFALAIPAVILGPSSPARRLSDPGVTSILSQDYGSPHLIFYHEKLAGIRLRDTVRLHTYSAQVYYQREACQGAVEVLGLDEFSVAGVYA
jgi:hypothetical protein